MTRKAKKKNSLIEKKRDCRNCDVTTTKQHKKRKERKLTVTATSSATPH